GQCFELGFQRVDLCNLPAELLEQPVVTAADEFFDQREHACVRPRTAGASCTRLGGRFGWLAAIRREITNQFNAPAWAAWQRRPRRPPRRGRPFRCPGTAWDPAAGRPASPRNADAAR